MSQTLKIINFEQPEKIEESKNKKKSSKVSFVRLLILLNFAFAISALSLLIFKFEYILQYQTIFTASTFILLLFATYLLGKISRNEKSYKLEVLTNKKLQNERTAEEMFYTSTIPLFQLTESGKFQLYNSSLSELLGSKKLEDVNFFNDFGIEPKVKKHIIQKLRMKGSLENYRLWVKNSLGNELYVNINCKLIKCNTNSTNVIEGSLFDITVQHKKEQAIARELENLRTEKIIGDNHKIDFSEGTMYNSFSPEIAHSLKTPISSMMGFLTLIEKDLYENKEELNNFTISAKKSGEELLDLINKIMNNASGSGDFEEGIIEDEENQPLLEDDIINKEDDIINKIAKYETEHETTKLNNNVKQDNSKPKLLLVEDNKLNQDVETKLLQKVGYNVEVIDNGEDAIELLMNNDYDLILMDIELNGMDGLETTKIIRNLDSEKSNIPIIAATAKSSMKDRERCLAAGMNDYISKPINITFMKMTIDQWLNQKETEV